MVKYTKIFKIISGSLSKLFSKESLIFCVFLVLSALMWIMSNLNDTMERDIEVPIRLVNIPDNIVVTTDTIDTIRVTVRDKGFTIAAYHYGEDIKPIIIDFASYSANSSDNITVSNAELQKLIAHVLYQSTRIVQVKPDRMIYYYNYGHWKKVPVELNGEIQVAAEHYLEGVTFKPDSVVIYGTDGMLRNIHSVKTQRFDLDGITKTHERSAQLQIPSATKCVPAEVRMTIHTDVLTEATMDVNITPVNVPAGIRLRLFPSHINVKFVVGTSRLRNIHPDQFAVEADYNTLVANPENTKCHLQLRTSPENIMRPQLETPEVEYLIEK